MILKLSVPSKTFLLGEYFITQNGSALIINTTPRFELMVQKKASEKLINKSIGITPASPAGQYLQANKDIFDNFHLEFNDAHQHQGGLGASSAQFLMLYAALHHLSKKKLEPQQLLNSYWQYCWTGSGIKPSGADIISQLTGEITYFNALSQKIDTYSWPFLDVNFYLLRTQTKVLTHEHLQTPLKFNNDNFAATMEDACLALKNADPNKFFQCINQYQLTLEQQNLVHPRTRQLLDAILKHAFILAAKGCGALGADVIIVFIKPQQENLMRQMAQTLNLPIIGSNQDLSFGLYLQEQHYVSDNT